MHRRVGHHGESAFYLLCARLGRDLPQEGRNLGDEDVELVEESAIVMWNIGISLLSVLNRYLVHKSLLKAAEILNEIDSNLMQLRVQLHLEVAKCEISHDLLTKGKQELMLAEALDSTLPTEKLAHKPQDGEDPAPLIKAHNKKKAEAEKSFKEKELELLQALYQKNAQESKNATK